MQTMQTMQTGATQVDRTLNLARTMSNPTRSPSHMFSQPLPVSYKSCTGRVLLGVSVVSILGAFLFPNFFSSLKKWESAFKSFTSKGDMKFFWRRKYPSFEEMHALFDRGDALMAAVDVATTLQLAHEEVGKILNTHSTFRADPMRHLVRTMAFIRIAVRSIPEERSQVASWLHKLHRPTTPFDFNTNVFILATIAYGLGRAHQVLGGATEFEVEALVSTIMNMGKILTADDHGQDTSVPTTLKEVTDYLSNQIKFCPSDLKEVSVIHTQQTGSLRAIISKKRSGSVEGSLTPTSRAFMFFQPLTCLKLYTFTYIVRDLTCAILASESPSFRPGMVLSIFQKLQPMFSHFHYTLCPAFLTFDGLFELLSKRSPSLRSAVDHVYAEIFGENAAKTKCRQSKEKNIGAHLPEVANRSELAPQRSTIPPPSLYSEFIEHLKCSYLRGQLQGKSVPQHLGVIMDGNRRFSKENQLGGPVTGHDMGGRKLLDFMCWCFSTGVRNLTVWALSDDNLNRDLGELGPLLTLLANYILGMGLGDIPISVLDIRIRIVGNRSILPDELINAFDTAEKATEGHCNFNLQLALGYGGRAEATRAMKRAVEFRAQEKSLSIEEALTRLTPSDVSRHTYSAELGLPEMDAIIRTSGEKRSSGFALWETQGAEITYVEAHWPALKESEFLQCMVELCRRNRRFGL
ncbi:unnamed protein product [Calypogeia fissa]